MSQYKIPPLNSQISEYRWGLEQRKHSSDTHHMTCHLFIQSDLHTFSTVGNPHRSHLGWSVSGTQRHADCSGTRTCYPLIPSRAHYPLSHSLPHTLFFSFLRALKSSLHPCHWAQFIIEWSRKSSPLALMNPRPVSSLDSMLEIWTAYSLWQPLWPQSRSAAQHHFFISYQEEEILNALDPFPPSANRVCDWGLLVHCVELSLQPRRKSAEM